MAGLEAISRGAWNGGATTGDARAWIARLAGPLRARALREPFVIFLIVGAAVFLLYWAVAGRGETIEVSTEVQRSLAEDYVTMTGREPDATQRAELVDTYVTDEVLFREAVARGMHMTDKATRQRLIDRVRFTISGAPDEPDEEVLVNYYAENAATYRTEPRLTVEHVFFETPPPNPASILARLQAGDRVAGDDFWMGRTLPDYGQSMLRGMFGERFLAALRRARAGAWVGPLASSRGTHFAKVTDRGTPALMPYPMVRDQVRQDYLASASGKLVDAEVVKLRKGYDVAVAE